MKGNPAIFRPAFKEDDREDEIHVDMSRVSVVDTRSMTWSGSPAEGVERKRLELIGIEAPQLTTLVRFKPGSHFAEHTHDGGEEFIVLDGTFSDGSGDYGPGSYVRNPPGTSHRPYTDDGCTILVKLRQFQEEDTRQFSVATRQSERGLWQSAVQGMDHLPLHHHGDEAVSLLHLQPGAVLPHALFTGGLEIFLMEGALTLDDKERDAGCWFRFPPGASPRIQIKQETRCYCKQGPLARYQQSISRV
ncbi:MAG: cupin domain-containing protein [Candidatus Thiodiazotropha sp. (ex Monitilora ramsayi)]|nr:cupin domain-containing protein [Candidatus Thiodiazotropha sp. (ex Monitilora ramsayi)]